MTWKLGAPSIAPMMKNLADSELIDALGGTAEVARLCDVRPPSVSEWRIRGIPKARRMYLQLLRPDVCRTIWPELLQHPDSPKAKEAA